mmetsp:Transcript_14404/g.51209  ORF Transcript_14404/g.51209 Transcript_14404/m.51209 type:complete len:408 (-) Transcript_14404:323-1546(-)
MSCLHRYSILALSKTWSATMSTGGCAPTRRFSEAARSLARGWRSRRTSVYLSHFACLSSAAAAGDAAEPSVKSTARDFFTKLSNSASAAGLSPPPKSLSKKWRGATRGAARGAGRRPRRVRDDPSDDPRGAEHGHGRGDGARRRGLHPRRGGGAVPGRVQGDKGPVSEVRRPARPRHAHHRGGLRRHRGGGGVQGPAARVRVHDVQLRHAGHGPGRQLGREAGVHDQRRLRLPRRLPRPQRRRVGRRRPALAVLRSVVFPGAGPQGRGAVERRGRKGPAQGRHPRPQPRHLPRKRAPLRRLLPALGRGAERRLCAAHRQGQDRARGCRRHLCHLFQDGRHVPPGGGEARSNGHQRRGGQPPHAAAHRPQRHHRLGQEDAPPRRRRGGLAAVRHHLGALRHHHGVGGL